MDNITNVTWYDYDDNFTDVTTLLPNETLSNVTKATGGGGSPRLSPGYYRETMETLWKVIPPIIMVWGLTGNFLTVMVFLRQMRRKVTSTLLYLMALAFADSIVLLCGPLRNFIKFNWDDDVRNFTDAGCRIQVYFTYASVHLSSWLLVAVTMERVLSVTLPHKVKFGCTPMLAMIVIMVTFVCVFGLNVFVPVMYGHDPLRTKAGCAPTSKEYQDLRDDVWNWIDFFVAFAVPFVILLVGNIIIIVHLYKSMKRKKRMTTSQVSDTKTKSISVLLILLCFVFFTTMTPISVFNIYEPYRYEEIMNMPTYEEAWYAFQYLTFQHAIVNLVGYTNSSFNFVMYVLSGSKFRNDLIAMICFCCKKRKIKELSSKTKQTTDGKASSTTDRTSKTNSSTTAEQRGTQESAKRIAEDMNGEAGMSNGKQDVIGNGVENAAFTGISEDIGGNKVENAGETGTCNVNGVNAVQDYTNKAFDGNIEEESAKTGYADESAVNENSKANGQE